MFRFYFATLTPVFLLCAASFWGGVWVWIALICMSVFAFSMDKIVQKIPPPSPQLSSAAALARGLAIAHFALWIIAVLSFGNGWLVASIDRVILFLAFGIYFGQISNSVAHELIHASARTPQRLGQWIYISLLFGHHNSSHRLVHHSLVATDADPNSARFNENAYQFFMRSWIGSFQAGWQAETKRLTQKPGLHPYAIYIGGAIGFLLLAFGIAGISGVGWLVAIAGYAQMQLLLNDYVQHYGLRRTVAANGRLEPVGPQHSWNAPHWYTSAMLLNAPRHSDHHMKPAKPYETLELDRATMPMLPYSIPMMAVIALIPPLWRRVMHRRLLRWQSRA